MGRGGSSLFYLLAGLVAVYSQALLDPARRCRRSAPAAPSPACSARYLVLLPRARILTLIFLIFFVTLVEIPGLGDARGLVRAAVPTRGRPGGLADFGGGVAYFAHVGGFLFGLAAVKLFALRRPDIGAEPPPPSRLRWRPEGTVVARFVVGALVILAVTASGVVIARRHDDHGATTAHARWRGRIRRRARHGAAARRSTGRRARCATASRSSRPGGPDRGEDQAAGSSRRPGCSSTCEAARSCGSFTPRRELPIASLTKMLTALIIAKRHRPRELVRITPAGDPLPGVGRRRAAAGKAGPAGGRCSTG